jgi:hypothetical protein
MTQKVSVEISQELHNSLQKLKMLFFQLTGKEVQSDEDVIAILASGFMDSLTQEFEQNQDGQIHKKQ